MAKEQKRIARKRNTETPDDKIASKQIESAASMLEFLNRARTGEMMPPEVIVQYATHFQDDLTLDNMPRMQLINVSLFLLIRQRHNTVHFPKLMLCKLVFIYIDVQVHGDPTVRFGQLFAIPIET